MSRATAQDHFYDGSGIGVQDEAGTENAGHDEADLIVSLLATGLLQAHRQVFYGAPLSVPYPAALQRGLDRLTLLAIRSGAPAPAGIPELVRWCHEPVRSWPMPLGGEALAGEVLMDLGIPTRACHEWAVDAADVESEIFENEVIADVRQVCQAAGRQDSYVAFRHLVISAPVLSELEFQQKLMDPVLDVVATMLKQCYLAAPLECQHDGSVTCCADCGNLLVGSADGLTCVDDRCPRKGRARRGQSLPVAGGVHWLAGPVRAFVAVVISHTVDAATLTPRPASSPWILPSSSDSSAPASLNMATGHALTGGPGPARAGTQARTEFSRRRMSSSQSSSTIPHSSGRSSTRSASSARSARFRPLRLALDASMLRVMSSRSHLMVAGITGKLGEKGSLCSTVAFAERVHSVDLAEVMGQAHDELTAGEPAQAGLGRKLAQHVTEVRLDVLRRGERHCPGDLDGADLTCPRVHVGEDHPVKRAQVGNVIAARQPLGVELG